MSHSLQSRWFGVHREWEDLVSASLGALIVISPVFGSAGVGEYVIINAGIAGVFICMLGLLQVMWLRRWEETLELACGAWIAASPYLFGYGGTLAVTHYVLGGFVILMALLELWQDRDRHFES
ncbi:MAG: SPW repeat protein [Rhodospirillales bacterium]